MAMQLLISLFVTASLAQASRQGINVSSAYQPWAKLGNSKLAFDIYEVPRINNAQNATAFALAYGAPLLSVASFLADPIANGTNKSYNQRELSSAYSADITRPNVDTLYTRVAIDLSQSDVSITVPEIVDRFYLFPFHDIFGSNFANLGTINDTLSGQYLLRQAANVGRNPGLELETIDGSEYKGYVNFPGTYGFMLIRILLLTSPTSHVDAETAIVSSYQDEIAIVPVERVYSASSSHETLARNLSAPPLSNELLNGNLTGAQSQQILELTSRIAPYNPPAVRNTVENVSLNLRQAGINNGFYEPISMVNVTLAENVLAAVSGNYLLSPLLEWDFGNGWVQYIRSVSGDFHSMFAIRAYVSKIGIAENSAYETLYPQLRSTSLSNAIGRDQSLLYTFSGKPPVTAFWSITIYGPDNFLINNTLNRYSLGDRSNITYPNGSLVYGGNAASSAIDDPASPFDILVQPANLPPPQNWTSNWLPAPSGGGIFTVNLRFYGPTTSLENGSYVYPIVTMGPAIV